MELDRRRVMELVFRLIERKYVFADTAARVVSLLRARVDAGAYDGFSSPTAFAEAVTSDLQAVAGDTHLRLVHDPDRITRMRSSAPGGGIADLAKFHNDGFARVEALKGGIGWVDIRHFFAPEIARDTAAAAMRFIAGCDAVIVDLRNNTGGNPGMVQFLCSYFFPREPRVHLNTITSRVDKTTTEYWTLEDLPGPRMSDAALYVLTSAHTFSGGEEFAYNMASLRRGILIGETTAGGANLAGVDVLDDNFYIAIPHAASINPITGTNWEGAGVAPGIKVPADRALETAHLAALKGRIAKTRDRVARTKLEWLLEEVESSYHPRPTASKAIACFPGTYGDTEVAPHDGGLILRRQFFTFRLVPLSETRFWLDGPAAGFEGRIDFLPGEAGSASAICSRFPDGREVTREIA